MPRLKPHQVRKHFETEEQKVGQDKPRVMKSTGPAKQSLEAASIEVVDKPVDKVWADQMAFNEEVIKVLVHESTDKNAEAIVEVFNGGIPQRFLRGQEQDVKRKFVEVLARAKMTTFTQEKYKDGDGVDSVKQVPHTALRYPFSVVNDPNPRGKDWLKAVLAEA